MYSTTYLSEPIASHVSSKGPWKRKAPCIIRSRRKYSVPYRLGRLLTWVTCLMLMCALPVPSFADSFRGPPRIYETHHTAKGRPMSKEEYEKAKRESERLKLMEEQAKQEAKRMREEHRNEVRALLERGMHPPGPVNR